jgi:hypothetical protein
MIESQHDLEYDENSLLPGVQVNKLGEFEFSAVPKWRLRMARLAMIGTSVGMQQAYIQQAYIGASGYSVQHVLYAMAGVMVLSGFISGRFRRLSKWLTFVVSWWYLALFVSTWFSPFRAGIAEFVAKDYLYLTVTILCGMAIASSQDSVRKFTNLMIVTAVVSSVLAAIQMTTGSMYFLASAEFGVEYGREVAVETGRAYGFFSNPNVMAHWLLIPIGVMIGRIVYPPPQGTGKLPWILLAVLLGGMMLSVSRSGIAATVLVFLMVIGARVFNLRTLGTVVISAIVITAGAVLLAPEVFAGIIERMAEFATDPARTSLIKIGLENIGKRPVIGSGQHSFLVLANQRAAHNGILEPLVELGIFGWVPVMLGIGGGIVCFWRCARLSRGTNTEWLWRGWAAGATGLVMSEFIHGSGWRNFNLWMVIAVGCVGLVSIREQTYYEEYYLDDE